MAHPANHLLLLDTCGTAGTLAVASLEPAVLLGQATLPGRGASERLVPDIRLLLGEHQLEFDSLGAIAIVHGPGSFTGIRVGLSAAKGLCEALRLPLIAISRLALLAENSSTPEVLALLDAGRGEFYCGHYRSWECFGENLLTAEQVLRLAGQTPGAQVVASEGTVLSALPPGLVKKVSEPAASDAMPGALRRFALRQFDDVAAIDANYVRRTDLEIFARQVRHAAKTGA